MAVPDAARRWLMLGVGALGVSTLLALFLVLGRVPALAHWFAQDDLLHRALVVHVTLAVLVWTACIACVGWQLDAVDRSSATPLGWLLAAVGVFLLAASFFFSSGQALLLDYVPLLTSNVFMSGLALFALGFCMTLVQGLVSPPPLASEEAWGGGRLLAVGYLAGLACFPLGAYLTSDLQGAVWGGGHVLQTVSGLLLLFCWLHLGASDRLLPDLVLRWRTWLLAIALIPALAGPLLYLPPVEATASRSPAFTWLMAVGGLLPIAVVALIMLVRRLSQPEPERASPLRTMLTLSAALYVVGVLLGGLIHDNNAMVPAHYHAAVGAVTLGLMAYTWAVLAHLGIEWPASAWVRFQGRLYGLGTLLLAIGLGWSGWLGAPRKAFGGAIEVDGLMHHLATLTMAVGGVAAISGSILFVLLVTHRLWRRSSLVEADLLPRARG